MFYVRPRFAFCVFQTLLASSRVGTSGCFASNRCGAPHAPEKFSSTFVNDWQVISWDCMLARFIVNWDCVKAGEYHEISPYNCYRSGVVWDFAEWLIYDVLSLAIYSDCTA